MVGRWWSLRTSALGGLWGSSCDLCQLMGIHFSDMRWRDMRCLVLRYLVASMELTFMQARGEDADLSGLVKRGILTDDEAMKLKDAPSRGQVIWTWVGWIFHESAKQGHMSEQILQLFYEKVLRARNGIGETFAYLNTQLPYVYVHLLATMVHLLCIGVAIDAGVSNCRFVIATLEPDDSPKYACRPIIDLLKLTLVPWIYYGCLEIAKTMTDPLGKEFADFPRHAYTFWMRSEAEVFHSTFEEPTHAAQKVAKLFVPK
eukprot:TRINITY_DN91979_c0_g1_i1.p1 TRINITY_DN91979_c0_g1~~TRINITY_DN91979_c0_g1_i1.p1  ORF type:complete len:259 (-),score=29.24 TRINITY_DN91979_c0_g1_i1:60-836(-)